MNKYDKHCICTVSIRLSANPQCKTKELHCTSGNNEIFLLVF